MDLTGKVIAIMQPRSGVSQRTGNQWMTQEYVIEVPGQYPKKMLFLHRRRSLRDVACKGKHKYVMETCPRRTHLAVLAEARKTVVVAIISAANGPLRPGVRPRLQHAAGPSRPRMRRPRAPRGRPRIDADKRIDKIRQPFRTKRRDDADCREDCSAQCSHFTRSCRPRLAQWP